MDANKVRDELGWLPANEPDSTERLIEQVMVLCGIVDSLDAQVRVLSNAVNELRKPKEA